LITYDYTIERDEGDSVVTYHPDRIPKELPNLVYIEGPNSSGKSTLLHILAAGFYATHLRTLNPSLRSKVERILKSDHQKVTFHFEIQNQDGSLRLVAAKKDPRSGQVELREVRKGRERLLAPETFLREYRLIYDIPDNPTQRLLQLVNEIKNTQVRYASEVRLLRTRIEEIINEVTSARDPRRIAELRRNILELQGKLDQDRQKTSEKEKFLTKLEGYGAARGVQETFAKQKAAEGKIGDLEDQLEKQAKRKRKVSRERAGALKLARLLSDDLQKHHDSVTPVLLAFVEKTTRQRFEAWKDISFDEALRNRQIPPAVDRLISDFRKALSDVMNDPEQKEHLEKARVYKELAEILRRYTVYDVMMPGTEKTIVDVVRALEEENKKHKHAAIVVENIQAATQHLGQMETLIDQLQPILAELQRPDSGDESIEEVSEDNEDVTRRLAELRTQKTKLERDFGMFHASCVNLGLDPGHPEKVLQLSSVDPDLTPFLAYTLEQVLDAIKEWKDDVVKYRQQVSSRERSLDVYKRELEKLENREPHPYQDRLEDLERVQKACLVMEQKLSKRFGEYLDALSSRRPLGAEEDAAEYERAIARFLARKISHVRHVQSVYEVSAVDLAKGIIHTTSKKQIRLDDMGTGQSQSAYLVGLLNADDGRQAIALFDEVAMMDRNSMSPVYERLRTLYREGRLLAGVVVQMADDIRVESISEADKLES